MKTQKTPFGKILDIFCPLKGKMSTQMKWKKEKKKKGIRAQFSLDILQFNIGNYSWHAM